jgi:hypothetical protein
MGQKHVVRLNVTVHHTMRMRVGEGRDHVPQCTHGFGDRKLTLPRQSGPQRLASDVWHDEVGKPLGFARGKQRHNVGVLKLGSELDLASKSLDINAGGEFWEENLHYNLTPQCSLMCDENS